MSDVNKRMETSKVKELLEIRSKLVKRVRELKEQLKDQEMNGNESSILFNLSLPSNEESPDHGTNEKQERKLLDASRLVSGITFRDVDRKLLHDDVYHYVAHVITKSINFHLELIVTAPDTDDFKIEDITCHFIGIDDCYMLEIGPWTQKLAKLKNFSLFMSGISAYSEQNIVRSKILSPLEKGKYVSLDYCTAENGGILVYVHPPWNLDEPYLKFQWSLQFCDQTCTVEHFFTINPLKPGIQFSEDNIVLLKSFCKRNLTKSDVKQLWSKLCNAIDNYKNM